MDLRYINPFVASAVDIIKETVGLVAIKKQIYVARGKESVGGVSIFFEILGDVEGHIIFDLPPGISTSLAKKMIGLNLREVASDNENKDMFKSAITELGNMISGSAITKLEEYNYNCDIKSPIVYVGPKTRLTHKSVQTIVIEMNTQVGDFSINLVDKKGFNLENIGILLVNIPTPISTVVVHNFIPKGFYIYSAYNIELVKSRHIHFVCMDIDLVSDNLHSIIADIRSHSKNNAIKIIAYTNTINQYIVKELRNLGITGVILKSSTKLKFISSIQSILSKSGFEVTERRKNIYIKAYPKDRYKINLSLGDKYSELIMGEITELGVTGVAFRPDNDKLCFFRAHDQFEKIQLNLKGKYVLLNGMVSSIQGDIVIIRFLSIKESFVNVLSETIYNKIA